MPLSVTAVTAGAATLFLDGDEARGEDRATGLELFETGLEMALDECGVLGNFHGSRQRECSRISDKYIYLSDFASKMFVAKKILFDEAILKPWKAYLTPELNRPQKLWPGAKNQLFLRAGLVGRLSRRPNSSLFVKMKWRSFGFPLRK